jgi:hypothetical protein
MRAGAVRQARRARRRDIEPVIGCAETLGAYCRSYVRLGRLSDLPPQGTWRAYRNFALVRCYVAATGATFYGYDPSVLTLSELRWCVARWPRVDPFLILAGSDDVHATSVTCDRMHRWLHSVTPHGVLRQRYGERVFRASDSDCVLCGVRFAPTLRDRYL